MAAKQTTILSLFTGSYYRIPVYQRDYAWEDKHVEDILNDIEEAVHSQTSHYLGAFIFSKIDDDTFDVVDGQQRLTTLVLILKVLIDRLSGDDEIKVLLKLSMFSHKI